jgi:AbrB family looped-hinge helix DNA binding protein
MMKSTISTKGQIVILKEVRERLNLKAGTEVVFDVHGEALIMKRAVRDFPDWRTTRGMARGGPSLSTALLEERAAEKARDDSCVERD